MSSDVDLSIPVLYRDEHLVVVYKPAGLLVHRSEIDRTETRFLLQILREQLQQHVYTVHRLDKPTAGLMVFALTRQSAASLSERFRERRVTKTYRAIVRGHTASRITIDYAFVQRFDALDAATHDREKTVAAVTGLKSLELFELPDAVGRYPTARYSHVLLNPATGAKHQLRRHLKHIFHPIVGDTTYGDSRHNRFFRDSVNCRRLMLCATRLSFDHPISDESVDVSTDPDSAFQQVLTVLDQRNLYKRMTDTQIESGLLEAYKRTKYRIFPDDRIDRLDQSGDRYDSAATIDLVLDQQACLPAYCLPLTRGTNGQAADQVAAFLTAHNPRSERTGLDTNQKLHEQLVQELDRRQRLWLRAVAQPCDCDWPAEEGVYLPDTTTGELIHLGTRFGQNAVVVIRSDQIPRLLLLR